MKIKRIKYQSHPWHGIAIHEHSPNLVNVFVEIVPTDTIKYEVDKDSGHLKVDRPQAFSNVCPAIYGFVPQTYCGPRTAKLCMQATGRSDVRGDGDPLDICILSEKSIPHGNILLEAIPIGGLRMVDQDEADDKIIAVLKGDEVYGHWQDIADCPEAVIKRLKHYFLTYKNAPGDLKRICAIDDVYSKQVANDVIEASIADYLDVTAD